MIKEKAGLNKPIEAVVVLFCNTNRKRMTFYSCNKGERQDKHRERDLDSGVVGLLIRKYNEKPRDLIVYYDQNMGDSFQVKNINRSGSEYTEKWEEAHGEKQSWTTSDTTSMFAIPFSLADESNNHRMVGALTFDLCDSLYLNDAEKDAQKISDICKGLIATRNAVEDLLTDNIIVDFKRYGKELDKKKKTRKSKAR